MAFACQAAEQGNDAEVASAQSLEWCLCQLSQRQKASVKFNTDRYSSTDP